MTPAAAPAPEGTLLAEVRRLADQPRPAPALPRHRHDLPREQVELAQRARIVLATAEVVVAKSYAATSSRDIVKAAGVSSKTFYALYDGKEEAFLAAFTLLDESMLALAQAPLRPGQPRTDLRSHVLAWLEHLGEWPLFARMRFVEGRAAGPIADAHRASIARQVVATFAAGLDELRRTDPRVGRPTDEVLALLYGGITDVLTQWVTDHHGERLGELVPAIVEAIERFCYLEVPAYEEGE